MRNALTGHSNAKAGSASSEGSAGAICAEPLREEVLPQRNAPGRCCREGNEFGKPGPGGQMGRNQQDLLLVLPELAVSV